MQALQPFFYLSLLDQYAAQLIQSLRYSLIRFEHVTLIVQCVEKALISSVKITKLALNTCNIAHAHPNQIASADLLAEFKSTLVIFQCLRIVAVIGVHTPDV